MTEVLAPTLGSDAVPQPDAPIDLSALMAKVATGDAAAFAAIYDAISGAAFGLALRVTNSHHLAEEVLQEVFLHVWHDASAFDATRGKLKAWILMLTHRRAVDCVRSVRAAADRDIADGSRVAASAGSDMADDLHLRVTVDELRVHLSQLTEAQQHVIALAYFEGCTQAEIAARLGHPLGTVKSRMRDALTRLRTATAAPTAPTSAAQGVPARATAPIRIRQAREAGAAGREH